MKNPAPSPETGTPPPATSAVTFGSEVPGAPEISPEQRAAAILLDRYPAVQPFLDVLFRLSDLAQICTRESPPPELQILGLQSGVPGPFFVVQRSDAVGTFMRTISIGLDPQQPSVARYMRNAADGSQCVQTPEESEQTLSSEGIAKLARQANEWYQPLVDPSTGEKLLLAERVVPALPEGQSLANLERIPWAHVEVIGHDSPAHPGSLPTTFGPLYRAADAETCIYFSTRDISDEGIVPYCSHSGEEMFGYAAEGRVGLLKAAFPAMPGHTLWREQDGTAKYAPTAECRAHLNKEALRLTAEAKSSLLAGELETARNLCLRARCADRKIDDTLAVQLAALTLKLGESAAVELFTRMFQGLSLSPAVFTGARDIVNQAASKYI